MHAATILAEKTGRLGASEAASIRGVIDKYGTIPSVDSVDAGNMAARLRSDKKTVQGQVHFVLPVKIGDVAIVSGVDDRLVFDSIQAALR
jgi:3-dehydroquinate synthase